MALYIDILGYLYRFHLLIWECWTVQKYNGVQDT
jgi:hypothetical protein